MPYYMPMMGYYGWGWGYSLIGLAMMVLFWAAVIWFIVWLLRRSKGYVDAEPHSMEMLKQRYAKGEITKKQFDDMKKDLK